MQCLSLSLLLATAVTLVSHPASLKNVWKKMSAMTFLFNALVLYLPKKNLQAVTIETNYFAGSDGLITSIASYCGHFHQKYKAHR